MEEFDFESQYADELDALDDIDGDERMPSKPRRSLHFETPKAKTSVLVSQGTPLSPVFDSPVLNSSQKKRLRETGSQSDSDLEYDDEDLNTTAPATKRPKVGGVNQSDNEDLWNDDFVPTPKSNITVKSLHENMKGSKVSGKVSAPAPVEDIYDQPPSPDRILMEKILEHRSKQGGQELKLDTEAAHNDRLVNDYDFERQRVFRRIPASVYLATTGTEGVRVYMKLQDDAQFDAQLTKFKKTGRGSNLLSVPISALREQLEEERRSTLLAESQRLSEDVRRQMDEDQGFEDLDDDNDKENTAPPLDGPAQPHEKLWVEKYTPRRYTDLLSEESINRSLLHWLRMWDYVVFNKELPAKPKDQKKKEENNKKNHFKKKQQFELQDELDQHRRPVQKVALLCGPPGLGKTTLAHIIARHAGYNVVEMNASDDRSAEVFKTKIENSTQMKAVLGADPRPNCLIIDEIDGAPQAAINVLLNVIRKTDGGEEGKKKKKDEGGILRRPIICICNDQYVPALRLLRQNALVMNFPQTDPTKLAGRLYEIVRLEKLRSDMNTLLALCEKTDNDIRSCLNTLQFIQGRCKELNMTNIQSMAIGQKDTNKSLFSVWYDVLALPRPKRQKFVNLQESGLKDIVLNTSLSARFNNVLSLVYAAGETEKLVQGLFENYLDCKFKDPYMDGVSLATDWLCFNDEVTQYIQHKQDYRLMPYLPYLAVTFHMLFASNHPPKIQFPHSMNDSVQRRTKCENLVTCMLADMCATVRKFINLSVIIEDILPNLVNIIQPTFRPVNTQLYSAKEKETLRELVSTMISYNMTYQQEKSLEGQYNYVLEPHVDELVKFPGMKQQKQLSYASKQLVAREIELEKMRKSELAKAPPSLRAPEVKGNQKGTDGKDSKTPAPVPSHLQRLTAKPLGKQEEVFDHFNGLSPDFQKDASDNPKLSYVLELAADYKEEAPEVKGNQKGTDGKESKTPAPVPSHLQRLTAKPLGKQEEVQVKDFFGRVIKRTSESKSTNGQSEEPVKKNVLATDIWFHFQGGYSNAVRRNVRVKEFL